MREIIYFRGPQELNSEINIRENKKMCRHITIGILHLHFLAKEGQLHGTSSQLLFIPVPWKDPSRLELQQPKDCQLLLLQRGLDVHIESSYAYSQGALKLSSMIAYRLHGNQRVSDYERFTVFTIENHNFNFRIIINFYCARVRDSYPAGILIFPIR